MRTKETKGITLIAMVITIIILLILVGVSLNFILGENGIITRAKTTGKIQTIATIKEALELEKVDIQVENRKVDLDSYLDQISKGKKRYDLSSKEKIDDKTAEIIINDEHKFLVKDKENGDVEITYEGIAKGDDLALSKYNGTYIYPESGTFTVTNNASGGELTVNSDAPNIVTASIDENVVTVMPGTIAGKANIIVKSSANGEYAENKVIHVATVENGTISLSVTPYEGTYDGQAHNAITQVDVNPSDAKLEYSLDGNTYSETMPTITNTSSFTVTVKASKAGYKTQTTTETVKVNKANGNLILSATSGTLEYPNSTSFTVGGNTGTLSVTSSNTNVATVSISGNKVTVKSGTTAGTATITVKSAASTNYNEKTATYKATVRTTIKSLKIGNYINYKYDTAGNYIVQSKYSGNRSNQTISQTKGVKWRVLNVNKSTGSIDLISEKIVGEGLGLNGILGYNNGPYLMNDICKSQYSNKSLGVSARNINLLDMEKHLTTKGINARNSYVGVNSGSIQYGKTKTYTGTKTYYPISLKNQKGAGINTTSVIKPDITKGNDPFDESKKIATTEPTKDGSKGQATKGLTITQTKYEIEINSTNYGEAYKVLNSGSSYWVAARATGTFSSCADFYVRFVSGSKIDVWQLYDSEPLDNFGNNSLRPVVTIYSSFFTGTKDSSGAWNLK